MLSCSDPPGDWLGGLLWLGVARAQARTNLNTRQGGRWVAEARPAQSHALPVSRPSASPLGCPHVAQVAAANFFQLFSYGPYKSCPVLQVLINSARRSLIPTRSGTFQPCFFQTGSYSETLGDAARGSIWSLFLEEVFVSADMF